MADQSGIFEFGLSLVGRARLLIDGHIVLDNGVLNDQSPGDSFYGLGTNEVVGVRQMIVAIVALLADLGPSSFMQEYELIEGQSYRIAVEFTNKPAPNAPPPKSQPTLMMAALRLGGCYKIDDAERAIVEAADLAASCDVVLCFTGSNMDWEAEGADRTQFILPGKTDQLVNALLDVKPETIICNLSGSAFAMPWADRAHTILQGWFGGNEIGMFLSESEKRHLLIPQCRLCPLTTGNAVADVLFGQVNPSGRMPLTWPKRIEDCTAHLNWGSELGRVRYGEGVFVSRGRLRMIEWRD